MYLNKAAKHARKFYASLLFIEFKREFREEKIVTHERKCIFVRIQMIESSVFLEKQVPTAIIGLFRKYRLIHRDDIDIFDNCFELLIKTNYHDANSQR